MKACQVISASHRIAIGTTLAKDAEDVEIERHVEREECANGYQHHEHSVGEATYEKGIENVGDIFKEERPNSRVQVVGLGPTANVQGFPGWNEQHAQEGDEQQHVPRCFVNKMRRMPSY